ncbi:uncharacterized protein RJT21DRAFT_119157 [Scheffersomyces amazonensis]|uniref:uncharacterized protein n=1 Tax=Scheffersomyces amazonensis TaxID=1078765 RepID=UPI00315CC2CB
MDIENIISSGDISITKHFLNLDIHQMLASLHQLAHVSERNIHYILPILFHPALRGIKMTTARSYYEKYFPEYIIHDAEDMYRYRFPLAIKENGIEFAYCNRLNQNSDVFLELMNQCLFKMMNINSKYGIAIDQTHVLFIIIKSSSSSKSFSIHHNGAVVQVKCKVACIPYSAGQYNLCSLIAGFAFNHFKEAGKESNFSIKDLKVISKLSASDFKREAEWRYKMMKDICIFKLKNFTKIGDWYFFEKTLFKVHQKYMTEALKLDLDFKFLPRNKIGKMELISSDRILKRFRVEVLDHKISNHRKGMFLKVFNAVSAPQQFKRTRSLQFFGTLSFVFNNFLRDIVLLRDKYPCGFSEEESSSDNRMNFDPCIFSCGFVDWEKKRIKGFYILTEFIETEYFRAKKGKLKRKRILNEVDFGIIHGDIHPNNLLLDKDKLTLVSPDFGLSNVYAIEKDKRANLQNNDFWKSTTNDS